MTNHSEPLASIISVFWVLPVIMEVRAEAGSNITVTTTLVTGIGSILYNANAWVQFVGSGY